jgi:hypothetical protein
MSSSAQDGIDTRLALEPPFRLRLRWLGIPLLSCLNRHCD